MKALLILAICFASLCCAEAFIITAGNSTTQANALVGAQTNTVTALLIYGHDGKDTATVNWRDHIVLLDRGPAGYTFAEKIAAAQSMGAVACIIADNGPSPAGGFAAQLATGTSSAMTVMLVTQADGLLLRAMEGQSVTIVGTPFGGSLPIQTGHLGEMLVADGHNGAWGKLVIMPRSTSGTAKIGSGLVLFADSDGTPPITFQWVKDGAMIQQQNNQTLSIPAVLPGDAGLYECVVTNPQGSATSGKYSLTVTP